MSDPRGVIGNKSGKGGSGASEAPNTLQSQATARLVEIISHGECVGLANRTSLLKSVYFDGVAVQNADDTFNYGGVLLQERVGLPNQDPFTGFSDVESLVAFSGLTIAYATPRTYSVTNDNIDAVRVTISINGLSKQSKDGALVGSTVSYMIERRVAAGAWETAVTETLNDKTTSVQQLSYFVQRPSAAGPTTDWEIRISRTVPDAASVTEQNSIEFAAITEITHVKLQYADLGCVAMAVDSKIFGNSLPGRAYDWVGMVLDVPSNYNAPDYLDPNNVTGRTYTGLWDGTFKRAWTDNPAWILLAMLTDRQWGLGRVIKPEQVDKWSLYQIAQYCDEFVSDGFGGQEPRYTINTQIASAEEAYAMLQSIASVFRGMLYWGSGSVTFTSDQPSDPVKLVSPANVISGSFSYQGASLKGRHSVVRVAWNDPSDRYQVAIEAVEDAEMIERFGWRPMDVVAYGCTSKGQAHRMGRWILNTERYESEIVTYNASFDHADVRPGNIIQVHDPYYAGVRTAGRLVSATSTTATIDSPFTFEIGSTYTLSMVTPEGAVISRDLTNPPGFESDTLTWSASVSALPTVPGTVQLFSSTVATQRARIWSITSTSVEFADSVVIKNILGYTLYFTLEDGTLVSVPINNPLLTGMPPFTNLEDREVKSLTWETPLGTLPPEGSIAFLGIPGEGYANYTLNAITTTSASVNETAELLQDYSYRVRFTMPDGTYRYRSLSNAYGDTTTFTWDDPLGDLPQANSMWGISSSQVEPRLFRVVSVHEAAPNIWEISALLHDPTKYARVEEGLELDVGETSVFQSDARPEAPTLLKTYRRPVIQSGVFSEVISIFWTASESILVNRYKVSYRFENNQWVDLPEVYTTSTEIPSAGPGVYSFRIIAVSFTNKESNALVGTKTLQESRPFNGATIARIRIEGSANVDQSATVSFTGADLKVQWNVVPPTDWIDTTLTDWEDPYLKYYRVQFMTSGGVVKNTFYTRERRFTLTKEHNIESNGGTALRTFKIGVALVDLYGTVYTEFTQEFTNPAPASATVTLTQTTSGVIATASACTDLDYGGTKIWVSTTNGFTASSTTPVANGLQYSVAVAGDPGTTYYARAAHYDDYSTTTTDLNLSAQQSITLDGVVAGDFDTTPPAVPTGLGLTSAVTTNPDGSQLVILTAAWTGVADSDLDHYEVALQEAAGSFVDFATTGVGYTWVVKGSTSYTAKVRAVDKLGNRSSYTATVNVTSTADTSAPSAPTGLAVTASLTALSLAWTNPTAADLDSVEVYENTTNNSATATRIASKSALSGLVGSFTRSGLATGVTRYYWLKARDTTGNLSAFTSVASGTTAAIVAGDLDTTAPAVPTGLGLTSAVSTNPDGSQLVILTAAWTGVADSDLDHYEVALQEEAGTFIVSATTGTSYTWVVKGSTSYTAKVLASDRLGNRSAYTSTVTATSTADSSAPSAPTGVAVSASLTALSLSWTNPTAADLDSVEIYENTTNNSATATRIASKSALSGIVGSFTRSGLATGVTRYYWLKARDTTGNLSAFTTVASGTTSAIVAGDLDTTAPAVPTSLALASAVSTNPDGSQLIILTASWTGVADTDLDHYEIALQEGAGTFIVSATAGTSYTWVVKGSTSYTAKVLACDKLGNRSAYTATVTATSTVDSSAPSAPTGLAATAGLTSITLAWTNPTASDLDSVEIYENTTNTSGTATRIATKSAVSALSGTYSRTGLATGATRYYWLKARDTTGNVSAFTASVSATTSAIVAGDLDTTAPAVPTALGLTSAVTTNPDGSQLVILTAAWTGVADSDLDHYEVALQEGAGTFVVTATPGTSYTWVVKGSTSYTAKVLACDKLGNRSAYTATVTATSTADASAPSAPSSLAVAAGVTSLTLSWTNPTAADLKFVEVWEHTANVSGSATKIATVAAVSAAPGSWSRSGLATGVTRYYWLKAVDTTGNTSAFSTGANGTTTTLTSSDLDTTAPAVPTGLALASALVTDTDGTQLITLTASWTGVANADLDHYEIALQEAAGSFIDFSTTATTYSWVVKGNVSYTVKVRAVDKLGNRSSYTATVNATSTRDTTAPSAPSSVAAAGLFKSIFITWTNPTASDLDGIEVWEYTSNVSGSATKIATVKATSGAPGAFLRGDLANSALRYYWLKAVDTSGNASAFSTVASATTALVSGSSDITVATITADRMMSGNLLNLSENATFEYGDLGWPTKGTGWTIASSGGFAESGSYYATRSSQATTTQIVNSRTTQCIPGEYFYARASVKTSATPTGGGRVRIAWLDSAGAELSATTGAAFLNGTTYQTSSVSGVAPASAMYAQLQISGNNSAGTTLYVDNVGLYRMTNSVLIEDGAVVAGKIAASAITGTEVSVSANLIVGEADQSVHISGVDSTYRMWAGNAEPANAPWRVTIGGKMISTDFEMRDADGALQWSSSGGYTTAGLNAIFASQASVVPTTAAKDGIVKFGTTDPVTGTQATGKYMQAHLGADSTVSISLTSYPQGYATSDTYPTITLKIFERYSADGTTWGSWAQVGSTGTFTKITSGTPTSSQYLVQSDTSYSWVWTGSEWDVIETTYYYPSISYPITMSVTAVTKAAGYYQYAVYGPNVATSPWISSFNSVVQVTDTDSSPSFLLNDNSSGSVNFINPLGAYGNLKCYCTNVSSTTVNVSFDYIIIYTDAGLSRTVRNGSLTASVSTGGVGGLDTGSFTGSTWYYLWLISNGVSDDLIFSLSATAPTMPSGYSFKKLISAVYITSGSVMQIFTQRNDIVTFMRSSTAGQAPRAVFTSTQGNINTPTFVTNPDGTPTTVQGQFTPANAVSIFIQGIPGGGAVGVAPNNSYGAWNSATPPLLLVQGNGCVTQEIYFETTDLHYYSNGGGNSGALATGFRLPI